MADDSIMDAYYDKQIVTALIGVRVDTKNIEEFAREAADFNKLDGVIKTETMMVVNTYKERGIKFE